MSGDSTTKVREEHAVDECLESVIFQLPSIFYENGDYRNFLKETKNKIIYPTNPEKAVKPEEFIDHYQTFLNRLNGVTGVGFSFGARNLVELALRNPEAFKELYLINPFFSSEQLRQPNWQKKIAKYWSNLFYLKDNPNLMENILKGGFDITPAKLQKIKAKTIFVVGENDRIITPESVKPYFDKINTNDKKFYTLQGTGHRVFKNKRDREILSNLITDQKISTEKLKEFRSKTGYEASKGTRLLRLDKFSVLLKVMKAMIERGREKNTSGYAKFAVQLNFHLLLKSRTVLKTLEKKLPEYVSLMEKELGSDYYLKMKLVNRIYVACRIFDDVVDGDSPIKMSSKDVSNYIGTRIDNFQSSSYDLSDPVDIFFKDAENILDQIPGIDKETYKGYILKILESMRFDAQRRVESLKNKEDNKNKPDKERKPELKVCSKKDLEKHYHELDEVGTVGAMLMTFGESLDLCKHIFDLNPLAQATRMYYDIRDLSKDINQGLLNISEEDLKEFDLKIEDLVDWAKNDGKIETAPKKLKKRVKLESTRARKLLGDFGTRMETAELKKFTKLFLRENYTGGCRKFLEELDEKLKDKKDDTEDKLFTLKIEQYSLEKVNGWMSRLGSQFETAINWLYHENKYNNYKEELKVLRAVYTLFTDIFYKSLEQGSLKGDYLNEETKDGKQFNFILEKMKAKESVPGVVLNNLHNLLIAINDDAKRAKAKTILSKKELEKHYENKFKPILDNLLIIVGSKKCANDFPEFWEAQSHLEAVYSLKRHLKYGLVNIPREVLKKMDVNLDKEITYDELLSNEAIDSLIKSEIKTCSLKLTMLLQKINEDSKEYIILYPIISELGRFCKSWVKEHGCPEVCNYRDKKDFSDLQLSGIESVKDFKKKFDPILFAHLQKQLEISKGFGEEVENVVQMISEQVENGGKRIRPLMVYLGYLIAGGDLNDVVRSEKLARLGVFIEVTHGSLLIDDDEMDDSEKRRGFPTIWKQVYDETGDRTLGKNVSVLGAGLAQILAYHGLDFKQDFDVQDEITSILNIVFAGQTKEVLSVDRKKLSEVSEDDILDVYKQKTADYTFVGPVKLGVIASGKKLSAEQKNALDKAMQNIGLVFQISDDLLDLFSNKSGKSIGQDIKEGKRTLMMWELYQKLKADDKKKLEDILDKKPEETTEEDIDWVVEVLQKNKIPDMMKDYCKKLNKKAKELLNKNFDFDNEGTELICKLSDNLINRSV